MNQFTLLVIILVVFTYYGGSNVPKVLKDNKELLLGVVGGLVLCSFLGMRLEGFGTADAEEFREAGCCNKPWLVDGERPWPFPVNDCSRYMDSVMDRKSRHIRGPISREELELAADHPDFCGGTAKSGGD